MKDIDDLIRETLSEEDAQWFEEWDEQSLTERVVDSFRGKSRWLVMLVYFAILVFTALMVLAAVKFFAAESTQAMIAWAAGFLFCGLTITMMKVWYWMELNRNMVLREVKRVELQLARLSNQLQNKP